MKNLFQKNVLWVVLHLLHHFKVKQHKKMIDERLPGVEWRPAGKHQEKYSLRISVDAHEGVENINAERLTEIAEKLASDMKIFVEIGKELKL